MVTGNATHFALMGYHLPPLIGLQYRFDTDPDDTRDYQDTELQPDEFVTDMEDALVIYLYVNSQTDDDSTQKVNTLYTIKKIKYTLSDASKLLYEITEDATYTEPGQKRFTIRARKHIMYEGSLETTVKITVEAEIETTADQGKKTPLKQKIDIPVKPCFLYAKLWVIPGQYRNTSEAGAMVGVRLSRAPWFAELDDLEVEVKVDAITGGPTLTVTDDPVQDTIRGTAKWSMTYAGLSFDTIEQAEFKVKCRIGDSDRAVSSRISVGRNVMDYLQDLEHNAGALDLTNPEFQHTSSIGRAADYLWPDSTLGILYNARDFLAGLFNYQSPPEWRRYTCGEYTRRLLYWSSERRFGYGRYSFETAQKMNGIELGEYTFFRLHDFFGFNLSGNDPWHEAKMIDPWWNQAYDDHVVLSLTEERIKLPAAITWVVLTGGLVIYFLGPSFLAMCLTAGETLFPGISMTVPYILGLIRAWIVAKLRGAAFDPKWTVGVFATLAAIAGAIFSPRLDGDSAVFTDDTEMMYVRYPKRWVEAQKRALIAAHANGLPPMDALGQW